MAQSWSFLRLPKPLGTDTEDHVEQAISKVGPVLADRLRDRDPSVLWSFQRLADAPGSALGLWFHSADPLRQELEAAVRAVAASHDWPVAAEHGGRPADHHDSLPARRLAERLAALSSDFALDLLRDGRLDADRQFEMAVLHLGSLVSLVPARERASFLFTLWQHRSQAMAPAERVRVSEAARRQADVIPVLLDGRLDSGVWAGYTRAVDAIVSDVPLGAAVPVNFLLFEHAQLTHDRLGLSLAAETLAANALRGALADGLPLTAPAPALQSA
ncbi:lantibiotic dehydratase C-terminal domain-containing protein [Kitasatospora mediocidica]|uniref:lantibiotic dehydratase C-terminal domain-containing protein n=1 Tax=Kitasatospora mediocidica TaxID=58352 RepID=UPI000689D58C|nr:lantibiotic dehydratase C-terminal domain-containing protein [Kitasatospora mediocidica]